MTWPTDKGGHTKDPEEKAAKLAKLEAERAEAKANGYLTPRQLRRRDITGMALVRPRRIRNKIARAQRQKRLEAESRARIAEKGGQGSRPVLNAKAEIRIMDAIREGRPVPTFEEARREIIEESRQAHIARLIRLGVIDGSETEG